MTNTNDGNSVDLIGISTAELCHWLEGCDARLAQENTIEGQAARVRQIRILRDELKRRGRKSRRD